MTKNIINKTVNVSLYDLDQLSKYKNKSEVVRKALDLFIEKEKRTKRNFTSSNITDTTICIGLDKETSEYFKSIYSDKRPNLRRYFSFSELLRVALRDFWQIEDSQKLELNIETEKQETGDYLERNGIKVIRVLK